MFFDRVTQSLNTQKKKYNFKFNMLETTQKTNTDNSEHKDSQNKHSETISMPVTKISCLKLISKIVLYVLAVVAFVVLIFSIIKAFWFLAILSFIFSIPII